MRKEYFAVTAAFLLGSFLLILQRLNAPPTTLSIEPPAKAMAVPLAGGAESVLSIPVSITEEEATRLLDSRLENPLYEAMGERISMGYGDATADVLLEKTAPLSVSFRDGKAAFALPFRFHAMFSWKGNILKIPAKTTQEAFGSGVLRVYVTPGLDEQWRIRLNDASATLEWEKKPSLRVFGQAVGVAKILSSTLDREAAELVKKAEDALNASAAVRDHAQFQWERLHAPIRLDDAPELWLSVLPLSVGMPPVVVENGRLSALLSLRSHLTVTTERPDPLPAPPLPLLHSMPRGTTPGFLLNVEGFLSYKALARYVMKNGMPPVELPGGGKAIVQDIAFYTGQGRLITAAEISGTALFRRPVSGTIYLQGIPVYSREEQLLRVTEVSFEEHTKDILLKAATWLMKPSLTKAVEKRLFFPLGDLGDKAARALESAFQGEKISPELTADGSVTSLDMEGFGLGKDGLTLSFVVGGEITLEYQER